MHHEARHVIEICPATTEDAAAVTALAQRTYTDAFGGSMQPSDLAAHLARHLSVDRVTEMLAQDAFLLARDRQSVVGFVQFGAADDDAGITPSRTVEIRRVYVLDGYQNLGIGARLMEAALSRIDAQSVRAVVLDVWEENHGARRFYERYGFTVCGERPFHVESGATTGVDLIMIRRRVSKYNHA